MGDRLLGLRVLLVDALDDLRHVLRHRLQGEGATVAEAGTGGDALKQADSQPFDVALVDLGLPDVSDESLIAALAVDSRRTGLVAAISAAPREDLARAIAAGAERVFAKPVDWDQLLRYLERIRPIAGTAGEAPHPPSPLGTSAT